MIAPWQRTSSAHSALRDEKKNVMVLIVFLLSRLVNQIGLRSKKSFRKWSPDTSLFFIFIFLHPSAVLQRSRAAGYTTLLDRDAGLEGVCVVLYGAITLL